MVEIVGNRTRILQLLASTDGIEDSAVGKPPPGTRPHQRGAALAQHGPDAVEVAVRCLRPMLTGCSKSWSWASATETLEPRQLQ